LGPGALNKILAGLPKFSDPRIIVGTDTNDDAGVFALTDDLALVQTVDFFSPITDDPYIFGQIAAANSLSDVYAMGGTPLTALNIVCVSENAGDDIMKEILRGGADKCAEAGVFVLGGHTVQNEDTKFGLAVTGVVNPKEVITNAGVRPNDHLILTKPLGSGIIFTASKSNIAKHEHIDFSIKTMLQLNKNASQTLKSVGVRAGTDITGFGFIGHCSQMCCASGVEAEVWAKNIPVMPGALEYAALGMTTGAADRNLEHFGKSVEFEKGVPQSYRDLLFDPQTSGGLLFAVPADRVSKALNELANAGISCACIGKCKKGKPGFIVVRE